MKALDVLAGRKQIAEKIRYEGKVWSGLRVSATRKKQPIEVELSRFEGCVGDIKIETVRISVDQNVDLVK